MSIDGFDALEVLSSIEKRRVSETPGYREVF